MTNLYYKNIEEILIKNILKTEFELKICVAWFSNKKLYDLILNLFEKGVKITIILSHDNANFINKNIDFQRLVDLGIEIWVSSAPNLMHNKFCIIDDRFIITGSYNWTFSAEKNNFENILVSVDKDLVKKFEEYFEFLLNKTHKISKIKLIKTENFISEKELKKEFELHFETENKIENKLKKVQNEKEYDKEIEDLILECNNLYINLMHDKNIKRCDELIKLHPNVFDFQYLKAISLWRLNKYYELKVICESIIDKFGYDEIDVINLLGIANQNLKNGQQSAIENFTFCIENFPDEFVFYKNRADLYNELSTRTFLPINNRNKYITNSKEDYGKVIKIVNSIPDLANNYNAYFSRASANFYLFKDKNAVNDINIAFDEYNKSNDKDKNIYNDMVNIRKIINKNKVL